MPDPAFSMLSWLVLGGSLGWLDGRVSLESERQQILMHMMIGAASAFGGGFLTNAAMRGGDPWYLSFVVALVTAVVVLGLWRAMLRGTGPVGRAP